MTTSRLRVFPAISRNRDPRKYVGELMRVAQFANRNRLHRASSNPASTEVRFAPKISER